MADPLNPQTPTPGAIPPQIAALLGGLAPNATNSESVNATAPAAAPVQTSPAIPAIPDANALPLDSTQNDPMLSMIRNASIAGNPKPTPPSFLSKLASGIGDATGLTARSAPGTTLGQRIGAFGNRMANAGVLGAGNEAQKQSTLNQEQIQAEMPLKLASLASLNQYRLGRNDIGQENAATNVEKAKTAQNKVDSGMALKGEVPDPNHPGEYIGMTPEQVMSHPILSLNRDLTESAINAHNAQAAASKADADVKMNPNNPTFKQKQDEIDKQLAIAQQNFLYKRANLHNADSRLAMEQGAYQLNYGQAPPGAGPAPLPGAGVATPPNGAAAPITSSMALGGQSTQSKPGGLNLNNAPDMMLVDPATGLPIPYKMLAALKPTNQEINRANFAKSAMASADNIQQLIDTAQGTVGPFAGRVQELMAKAGLGNKFNQELQNYVRFAQSAATAAHTGRFSVPILDKMDKMIDVKDNPDQVSGALASIKTVMAPYADEGWKPTVVEWKAWQSGQSKSPGGTSAPPKANPDQPQATHRWNPITNKIEPITGGK